MKKGLAVFFAFILIVPLLSTVLGSLPVHAQGVIYNWVDAQSISGSDGTYYMVHDQGMLQPGTNGEHVFVQQNQDLGCPNPINFGGIGANDYYNNIINFGDWGHKDKGSLHTRAKSTVASNQTCSDKSDPITIGSTPNASITFDFINASLIRHIINDTDGVAGDFILDAATGQYVSTQGSSCKDFITLNSPSHPKATPTGGVLHSQQAGQNGGGCVEYWSSPISLGIPGNYHLPAGTGGSGGSGGGAGSVGPPPDSCEAKAGDFGWIICPLTSALDAAMSTLQDSLIQLMTVDRLYNDKNGNLHTVWATMRNIALLMLVPIMLVMVIGTALDYGPFDAYTVKKALPRMFAAVMFISLSWPIVTFLIDLSDVVGIGVLNLIQNIGGAHGTITLGSLLSPGQDQAVFWSIIAGTAVTWLGGGLSVGIVISLAVSAFLALLVGYLTLLFRLLAILSLLIFSPLAILAWIFPGNDRIWKFWKDGLITLLTVYPVVMAIIGIGRVMAYVISQP
jgi:hypothetical protein